MPLWKHFKSNFSLGECTRSSSSAKPTIKVSMPSTVLKSPTMGIEPPAPMVTAFLPHSSASAVRALPKAGLSNATSNAGLQPKLPNSTEQSAGTRARTKSRKALRIFSGSWAPTRRNETLALALPGITVLAPSPV